MSVGKQVTRLIIKSFGAKLCESCCVLTLRVKTYQYLKCVVYGIICGSSYPLNKNWYDSVLIDLMENPLFYERKELFVTLADAIRY